MAEGHSRAIFCFGELRLQVLDIRLPETVEVADFDNPSPHRQFDCFLAVASKRQIVGVPIVVDGADHRAVRHRQ